MMKWGFFYDEFSSEVESFYEILRDACMCSCAYEEIGLIFYVSSYEKGGNAT